MKLGQADYGVIEKALDALSNGLRRVEAETVDGRRVTAYYVTERQVRVDTVEANNGK